MPDGTRMKQSSAWSSWSGVSYGGDDIDQNRLDEVHRQMERENRRRLDQRPANVEPGFEDEYRTGRRSVIRHFVI